MTNRRRFITIVPFAGAALLAACSKETSVPATTPMPAPAPDPSPMTAPQPPAPVAETPAPAEVASNLPLLDESAPAAVALGYVAVASNANASKYPTFAAGQACSNCALYAGKATDVQAPCPLFAGNQVLAAGWCSAWVKKA